jgi:glutaminyl-tRNA synthetase
VAAGGSARTVGALLANEVRALQKEGPTPGLDGGVLGRLAALVDAGRLTSPLARRLLARLAAEGGDPEALMRAEGWEVVQDEAALRGWVEEVLAANPDKVAAYRGGRAGLFGFFVGGVLQRSGGRADPVRVRALLEAALAAPGR